MDLKAVETSYARWAPIYDRTFGMLTNTGRRRAVAYINERGGKVLEIGVGTGLALPHYQGAIDVTGIDFSAEMLAKAEARVREQELSHVTALRRMDARALDFPDATFDTVAAMHVLSVVPDPESVMAEIARVCKPGGQVVITNHFKHDRGLLAFLSRVAAPFSSILGWHSDFEVSTVLKQGSLTVADRSNLPPLGMMTFLVLQKTG